MTKQIKILGTGCSKCQQTTDVVTKTVAGLNADAHIEKVEDIMEIMKFNVMSTPAVVIDGEVKISGRIPSKSEIEALLK